MTTRKGCQTIIRQGFEYAKKHVYKTVTIVEKPNVIRETSGLMVREARKIATEYPGIDLWETNIDAMCMWLVKNPQNYEVFSPESVGLERQMIIGKHSGSKAILHKFDAEFGIEIDSDTAAQLLEKVRDAAIELKRPLFDKELMLLYREIVD